MDFKELLELQDLTETQINKIISGMKECKIYTTTEENLEIRYGKLKHEKEQLEGDLKEANKTLKELKNNNADLEELQTKISNYETSMKNLEKAREKDRKEFDIKARLKDLGCKDMDYILFKLGDIEKLSIEKDLDNKLKELKENSSSFFSGDEKKGKEKQEPKVIVNKLPGAEGKVRAFTKDEVSSMSPQEINVNWDVIKDLDLSK